MSANALRQILATEQTETISHSKIICLTLWTVARTDQAQLSQKLFKANEPFALLRVYNVMLPAFSHRHRRQVTSMAMTDIQIIKLITLVPAGSLTIVSERQI